MKNIFKLLLLVTGILFMYSSCRKAAELPLYSNGTPTVLTSSVSTVASLTADSNKAAVTFVWTSPQYSTDSANQKFIIEIDSSGRNFSKEITYVVNGALSKTFLAKELNVYLLALGFAFNKPYDVDVRITSSYANNNERYQSNVLKLKMTAYLIPPKVVPPATKRLFLVGSASAGGWNNAVPAPAQEFTKIDSVTYQGTFFLNAGGQYVFLPLNGDWGHKFNVADASATSVNGGSFGADLGNANIPGPATTGMYTIKVDFQSGIFTVTKVSDYGLLYVPGDYQGWTPATAPTLGSPANDGKYDGYINIPAGGTYQFKLASTPDFNNVLGDGGNGTLSASGGNLTVPGGGYYHIEANTVAKTWLATKITSWSLIGSFAASAGFSIDIPMTYNASENRWIGTITTAAGDQFKFRSNNSWTLNYGDDGGKGSLVPNGANIGDPAHTSPVPPGAHTIILYLNNGGYYTYSIQ